MTVNITGKNFVNYYASMFALKPNGCNYVEK